MGKALVPTWAHSEALLPGQADNGLSLGPDEEEVPRREILTIPQVEGKATIQGSCGKHKPGHWGGPRRCSSPLTWRFWTRDGSASPVVPIPLGWCRGPGTPQPCPTLVHEEDEAVVNLGLSESLELGAGL